jgi:hypothetical protein
MANVGKSDEAKLKGQQAGRRLSGNQQRELTREQTKHPEGVDSAEEQMKNQEKKQPRAPSGPQPRK